MEKETAISKNERIRLDFAIHVLEELKEWCIEIYRNLKK